MVGKQKVNLFFMRFTKNELKASAINTSNFESAFNQIKQSIYLIINELG